MKVALAIAAGGAVGAVLRYWITLGMQTLLGRDFPWGTLTVNILGSLIAGLLLVLLLERARAAPEVHLFLLTGVLGGFTTFSAFSIETVLLIDQGEALKAALNVMLNVTLCVGAVAIGMALARALP